LSGKDSWIAAMTKQSNAPKRGNGGRKSQPPEDQGILGIHRLFGIFKQMREEAAVVVIVAVTTLGAVVQGRNEAWCFLFGLAALWTYGVLVWMRRHDKNIR
jgi:hypothetical protein